MLYVKNAGQKKLFLCIAFTNEYKSGIAPSLLKLSSVCVDFTHTHTKSPIWIKKRFLYILLIERIFFVNALSFEFYLKTPMAKFKIFNTYNGIGNFFQMQSITLFKLDHVDVSDNFHVVNELIMSSSVLNFCLRTS